MSHPITSDLCLYGSPPPVCVCIMYIVVLKARVEISYISDEILGPLAWLLSPSSYVICKLTGDDVFVLQPNTFELQRTFKIFSLTALK